MDKGRVVFHTKWFDIEELDLGVGAEPYYRLNARDAVIVFTLTCDMHVLLVKQLRPARGHETLEIPAGGIEENETPREAALREVREETGYEIAEIYELGKGGLRLDRDSSDLHTFVAFGAFLPDGAQPELGPAVRMPLARFSELIARGEFEQLGALSAVLQALARFGDRLQSFFAIYGKIENKP